MDLLDDLDQLPTKSRTFHKDVHPLIESDLDNEMETQVIDGETHQDISDFFDDDDNEDGVDENNIVSSQKEHTSTFKNPLALPSILRKVKRRLNGDPDEPESSTTEKTQTQAIGKETQVLESSTQIVETETQVIQTQSTQQIRPLESKETQVISTEIEETQKIESQSTETQKLNTQANPLGRFRQHETGELTESFKGYSSTIPVASQSYPFESTVADTVSIPDKELEGVDTGLKTKTRSNLFLDESDSEQEIEILESTNTDGPEETAEQTVEQLEKAQKEAKARRIEELALKKRTERLLKEHQELQKNGNDLDNKPQVQENDEYSDAEEREQRDDNIDIEVHTVKTFDKSVLFKAFGMSTSTHGSTEISSQPETSLVEQEPRQNEDMELSSDSDEMGGSFPSKTNDSRPTVSTSPPHKPIHRFKPKEPEDAPAVVVLEDDDSESEDDLLYHSKAAVLEIKAKFSKRMAEKKKAKRENPAFLSKRQLFNQLMNANRKQIQEEKLLNPEYKMDDAILKQDATNVQDLLKKHIEMNNRLKEKEDAEARKEQGLDDDDESDGDYEKGEVPDSDLGESYDEDDEESDEEKNVEQVKRKTRRMVVDDDEELDEVEKAGTETTSREVKAEAKDDNPHDDDSNDIKLGDFGGNLSQPFSHLKTNGDTSFKRITMTQLFERGSQQRQAKNGIFQDIFAKMREAGGKILGEEPYRESDESQDNKLNLSYNVDMNASVEYEETQNDSETQVDPTTKDNNKSDDEGDEIQVFKPKRLTNRKEYSSDEDEEEEQDTEEQRQERIKQAQLMKQQRREYEQEQKRKKKEMKAKGLDKMMENEAEESEDEWFGVGGADGERSDEENSEDEAMLDDVSKIKFNKAAIEAKIRDETSAEEKALLERILKDLEDGKLGKRGKDSEFDLDIDDGEDEVMRSYRIYNQMKKREQIEQDESLRKLAKDKKSRAFFESITADSYDSKKDIFGEHESEEETDSDDDENPFDVKKSKDFKDPSTIEKKNKVTVAFVQKTLSFISNPDENDESALNRRYSNDDDDGFGEDLRSLKQNSIIKIAEKTPERRNRSSIGLNRDNDSSPTNLFKIPSIIARGSFQSIEKEHSNEVTIASTTKSTSSSKASIMSFGKRMIDSKKSEIKEQNVLKVRKIASKFSSKNNRLKALNGDEGFNLTDV